MSQTKWSERQKTWRQETLAKAREREQKAAMEQSEKERESSERWQRVAERVKELEERLAHLVEIPVRYDSGAGKLALYSEVEETTETPADMQEVAWVRVYVKDRGYVCFHIGVSYRSAVPLSLGVPTTVDKMVTQIEKWVEEHAYGSSSC